MKFNDSTILSSSSLVLGPTTNYPTSSCLPRSKASPHCGFQLILCFPRCFGYLPLLSQVGRHLFSLPAFCSSIWLTQPDHSNIRSIVTSPKPSWFPEPADGPALSCNQMASCFYCDALLKL